MEIWTAGVFGAVTPARSSKESIRDARTLTLTSSSFTNCIARLTKCGAAASNYSLAICTLLPSRSFTSGCCIIAAARDGVICKFWQVRTMLPAFFSYSCTNSYYLSVNVFAFFFIKYHLPINYYLLINNIWLFFAWWSTSAVFHFGLR